MTMNAPHENSAARYSAADRAVLLRSLEANAGFIFYCEQLAEKMTREIDAKVWDTKTTDEEARILRETRKRLTGGFSPEKIVKSLIAAAEQEAERDKSASA